MYQTDICDSSGLNLVREKHNHDGCGQPHLKKVLVAMIVGHSFSTPIHIQVNQQREKHIILYL